MNYSEAIREGINGKPQGFGPTLMRPEHHAIGFESELELVSVCANEAARMALRINNINMCPEARGQVSNTCPLCGKKISFDHEHRIFLSVFVVHLNDDHRMSRDGIADYIHEKWGV